METKKINWANDFTINESLHSLAQELSAAYGRMCFNNKNHPTRELWKEKSAKWSDYDRAIKDLVFDSEQIAGEEVNRLTKECNAVLTVEMALLQKGAT